MEDFKIKNKETARIFKNPFLEFLSKTSPALIFAAYLPIIAGSIYLNYRWDIVTQHHWVVLIFLSGIFAWTFFEYILHRYVYHFITEHSWTKKFHYYAHGIHHEYPRDREHLFMPPLLGYVVAAIFYFVFELMMGEYVYCFLPGFITGWLIYGFMHYSMHAFKPPAMLKALWKHHSLHHYKYNDKAFGVSSRFWDLVFGTMPPEK